MEAQTIVQLHPDGRITKQRVGAEETLLNPEEFLRRFTTHMPQFVKDVARTPHGTPIHAAGSQAFSLVCFEVEKITLNTPWTNTNPMVPAIPTSGSVFVSRQWRPPMQSKLIVIGVQHHGDAFKPYLVIMGGDGQCYRCPIPNIHQDSRICLGNGGSNPITETYLIDKTREAIEIYNRARCNAELQQTAIDLFCAYAPDDSGVVTQTVTSLRQPVRQLQVVSSPVFSCVSQLYGHDIIQVGGTV